jgi:hypothetical protein
MDLFDLFNNINTVFEIRLFGFLVGFIGIFIVENGYKLFLIRIIVEIVFDLLDFILR